MVDEREDDVQFPESGNRVELLRLRRSLEHHHRTLRELSATAPSERLGRIYGELIDEIDEILERMPAVPYESDESQGRMRKPTPAERSEPPNARKAPSRVVPLVVVATILFASLGGLWLWTQRDTSPDTHGTVVADPQPFVPPPPPRVATLSVHPAEFDFGNVRTGGRYVQNFELSNDGDSPLRIRIERSGCHCLWFQHDEQIPPRGIIPLVVALDTSQLDPGPVTETVRISSERPPLETTIRLSANVTGR